MADVFSKWKRSQIMASVCSTGNRLTEGYLAAILRRHRITGWRRHLSMLGKPDFTFRKERVVIFVDGCFWHGCPRHLRLPSSNRSYWRKKIDRNRVRDRSVTRALGRAGWRVLRFWEHELRDEHTVLKHLARALGCLDQSYNSEAKAAHDKRTQQIIA